MNTPFVIQRSTTWKSLQAVLVRLLDCLQTKKNKMFIHLVLKGIHLCLVDRCVIEQDHRFIKKLTRPMKGFKSFQSASATLDGIEVAHMIRKRQFGTNGQSVFQQFASLAA